MKILHILNSNAYSGAENVAISIIEALRENIEFIYMSPCGTIQEVLKEKSIEYFSVPKLSVANIKKAIQYYQPDIIHAHDFTAGTLTAMTGTDIPIISHLHNNPPWIKKKGLKSKLYHFAAQKFSSIITVSDAIMEEYIYGEEFRYITKVVGNPVNIEAIRNKSPMAELQDSSDIAFFGRLSAPKNPLLFLDIINMVKKSYPSIQAVMIGNGELRKNVEDRIQQLELQDNVKLYGFVKNPYGLVNHTKVVCMPSVWEGYGLTAVESLALGKPVIAAPVGGLVGIVDEECGAFCNCAEDYEKVIVELLNGEKLYGQKSLNASRKAETLDNYQAYMNEIREIYEVEYDRK